MRLCSVDGCESKHYMHGYCIKHNARWEKYGDPLFVKRRICERGLPVKFLEMAKSFKGMECLIWPHAKHSGGYGVLRFDGKVMYAHMLVCEHAHGERPKDKKEVAHSCGNRACVNPSHLRWATVGENQADRLLHDTDNRGEKHGMHKLTELEVLEIRKSRNTHTADAELFGVCRQTISTIKSRESWSWL